MVLMCEVEERQANRAGKEHAKFADQVEANELLREGG
jgi:hypothetical protein